MNSLSKEKLQGGVMLPDTNTLVILPMTSCPESFIPLRPQQFATKGKHCGYV